MSLVDLTTRLTPKKEQYSHCVSSSNSLIHVSENPQIDPFEPVSLDLSVGDFYYDSNNDEFTIEEEGITLRPGSSAVIRTRERIEVPHNVFGLVTGKGKLIFKGLIISPGKIDPGFRNHLKIAVFNGGRTSVTLQKAERFCTCCFLNMESHLTAAPPPRDFAPAAKQRKKPIATRLNVFWSNNWKAIVPALISALALVVAFLSYLKK